MKTQKIFTLIGTLIVSSQSYAININNSVEASYKKIDIDTSEETGGDESFKINNEPDGYYLKYNLKLNNTTLSFDYENIKDKGKSVPDYTGPLFDDPLVEYSTKGVYLSHDILMKNINLKIVPQIGYKETNIKEDNTPYVSLPNESEKFNTHYASIKIQTINNYYYLNPYIMAEYQNTDLSDDDNDTGLNKDHLVSETMFYSVGADIPVAKKFDLTLKYSFAYNNNQYNENISIGKYINSDFFKLGLRYNF